MAAYHSPIFRASSIFTAIEYKTARCNHLNSRSKRVIVSTWYVAGWNSQRLAE